MKKHNPDQSPASIKKQRHGGSLQRNHGVINVGKVSERDKTRSIRIEKRGNRIIRRREKGEKASKGSGGAGAAHEVNVHKAKQHVRQRVAWLRAL